MKRLNSKQSGFTLVEIAIVLVIIGLLLGGVLKGQEMITSSKGKALDNEKAGIQAAFTSYSDRYKAVAGDDLTASARFTNEKCGGAPCANGSGNGALVGAWNTFSNAAAVPGVGNEQLFAWQHLRAAGFLKEGEASIFSSPRHSGGGRVGVQPGQLYVGQNASATAQAFIGMENVPTNVAQSLDSSVDDGFINLGVYRGAAHATNGFAGASYSQGVAGTGAPNAPGAATNVVTYNVAAPLF
jgi:prepilin-type N-terminal cleavage/methylation domain-containing protein